MQAMKTTDNPEQPPGPPPEKRPLSNRAQIVSAIFSTSTAIAACFAALTFCHATAAQKRQNAEESIARLYPLDVGVSQRLGEHPKVRAALYDDPDGKIFHELNPKEATLFAAACDAVGDEFEYYLLIRDHIRCHRRGDQLLQAWDAYLRRTWRRSYGLRQDVNADREIFTTVFLKEFERNTSDLKSPSPAPVP
jgi:hypothetical protein